MTPVQMQALFEQAVGFHQRGQVSDAERIYLQLLAAAPRAFPALHMLAILRGQQGRNAEAGELIHRALQVRPRDAGVWMNYANILKAQGRAEDALAAYDQGIGLDPRNVDAFCNHAVTLLELGRHVEALVSCDRALALDPFRAQALYSRGIALTGLKRFEEALAAYDQILARQPSYSDALNNRGTVLSALDRHAEALTAFDQVLALDFNSAQAHSNRGNALRDLGRLDEALSACAKALEIDSGSAIFENNYGAVLWQMHRFAEALEHFDRAVNLKPDFGNAHSNLGQALQALQRNAEAVQCYRRAVELNPGLAGGWSNLGAGLYKTGFYDEALAACDRAISLDPHDADAHYQQGVLLRDLKRNEEALASFERTLALKPGHRYAMGMAADMAASLCDWARVARYAAEAHTVLDADATTPVMSPQIVMSLTGDPAAALCHARRFVRDLLPSFPLPLWQGAPYPHPRIRVAYLSADFKNHPVGHQLVELIEGHDRARFEVIGVSLGGEDGSDIRGRLARAFDRFEDVHALGNLAAAQLLRRLEVDIAVDLNGHTSGGRLEIFAHRPAPVQTGYFGYSGTTGADFMDYVIADRVLLPDNQQAHFTENIVRLPYSFWPAQARPALPPPPSRREAGLPEKGFVFCAFNNPWKIGAEQFGLWMRLLKAVPGSVLWLKDEELVRDTLRRSAAMHGVDPARLVFAGRLAGRDLHLARHRLADLFLDALPYNAHATASDALVAGLPVLTCAGESFAGRVAASLVTAAGLPELVTQNLADYETLALVLARHPAQLAALRTRLNNEGAPLFDARRFRQGLEAAFVRMHDIAARGETPRPFNVEG